MDPVTIIAILKKVGSFIWKYKYPFLILLVCLTLYFGYKHIQSQNQEIEDLKQISETAIAEHNRLINNYKIINNELDDNKKIKDKLESENDELKKKIKKLYADPNTNKWANTIIPNSIIKLLLEIESQRPKTTNRNTEIITE